MRAKFPKACLTGTLAVAVLAAILVATPAAAGCVAVSGSSYVCTGTEATGQVVNASNAAVSTGPGFSVGPTTAAGLDIVGSGALSFHDLDDTKAVSTNEGGLWVTSKGDAGGTPGSVEVGTDGDYTGRYDGIQVRNSGGGAISITANGNVTGTEIFGIEATNNYARNDGVGTDLTIITGADSNIFGGTDGIQGRNYGTGDLSITVGGIVTAAGFDGIDSLNYGKDLSIVAGAGSHIEAGDDGIVAENNGSGIVSITADGYVDAGDIALSAVNNFGTNETVTTGLGSTLTGANYGIQAHNYGSGDLTVTVNGIVTGTAEAGIHARLPNGGSQTINIEATAAVTSGNYGVWLDDSGAVNVAAGGSVTGGRHGIWLDTTGSIVNRGSIIGTDGGSIDWEIDGQQVTTGAIAIGGAGSLINSGVIKGGLTQDGIVVAVGFAGDDNRVELQKGSTITGLVVVEAGGLNNVLALGGDDDDSFELAGIDTQYLGFSSFEKTGGSTWELTGATTSATPWTIRQGGLMVDGTLGGAVTVLEDARLMGNGTVGTTTIQAGGVIAPGSSIGTFNIDGDLTMEAGSIYEVEVDPGSANSDLIAVTGTATLEGGSVLHVGATGAYDLTSTYTILSAAQGVSGEFADVFSDFAFLTPTLTHDLNVVTLTLERNDVGFVDVAQTRNQHATATGLEGLPPGNDLFDAVVQLDEASARSAFDQLSGEIHASVRGALIEDSRHVRDAATARLAPATIHGPGLDAWGLSYGAWGETDGNGNAAGMTRNTAGMLVGIDTVLLDQWRFGVMAGYSRSSVDIDARGSSSDSDSYRLGVYGGSNWGPFGLRAGAALGWHDIQTHRDVGFLGFADSLEAGYGAMTTQAFGEASYGIETGIGTMELFGGLSAVAIDVDGFAESGGAAALIGNSGTTSVGYSDLGVRLTHDFTLGDWMATARGMLGWRRAFGDTIPSSNLSFSEGDAFAIAGAPIAKDTAVLEAGLDLHLADNARLSLAYDGQFGSGAAQHGATVGLSIKF